MDSGKLRIKGTDKLLFYPHEKKFGSMCSGRLAATSPPGSLWPLHIQATLRKSSVAKNRFVCGDTLLYPLLTILNICCN